MYNKRVCTAGDLYVCVWTLMTGVRSAGNTTAYQLTSCTGMVSPGQAPVVTSDPRLTWTHRPCHTHSSLGPAPIMNRNEFISFFWPPLIHKICQFYPKQGIHLKISEIRQSMTCILFAPKGRGQFVNAWAGSSRFRGNKAEGMNKMGSHTVTGNYTSVGQITSRKT